MGELEKDVTHISEENVTPSGPTASATAASMFSYFKSTADAAQKRITPALRELSKAEDAADAYLNRWGANLGQMLREVVTIAPPAESDPSTNEAKVLFDTNIERNKTSIQYRYSLSSSNYV